MTTTRYTPKYKSYSRPVPVQALALQPTPVLASKRSGRGNGKTWVTLAVIAAGVVGGLIATAPKDHRTSTPVYTVPDMAQMVKNAPPVPDSHLVVCHSAIDCTWYDIPQN